MSKILTLSIPVPNEGNYNLQIALVRQRDDPYLADQPGEIIRHSLSIDRSQLYDESLISKFAKEIACLQTVIDNLQSNVIKADALPSLSQSQKTRTTADDQLPW